MKSKWGIVKASMKWLRGKVWGLTNYSQNNIIYYSTLSFSGIGPILLKVTHYS